MTLWSRLCGLLVSMCNTEKNHCPLCRLRLCEFNFPPYRKVRCYIKFFIGLVAERLGWDFLALRDKIESQFDQYMFWHNCTLKWYIDEDALQPVWQKGA